MKKDDDGVNARHLQHNSASNNAREIIYNTDTHSLVGEHIKLQPKDTDTCGIGILKCITYTCLFYEE